MMSSLPRKISSFIIMLGLIIGSEERSLATMGSSYSGGVCQYYTGRCSQLLNSSEPRYINSSLGMNETEDIAIKLLEAVKKIFGKKQIKDDVCKEILEKTVCSFVFPFCSSQQKKLDYCREDCNYISDLCGKDLDHIVGAGKFILHGKISAKIFDFHECKDLRSASDTSGNVTCRHLSFIDMPVSKENDSETLDRTKIVLLVVIPLTMTLIILLCIRQCRLMRRAKLRSIQQENGSDQSGIKTDKISNVVSMRDRIRDWKLAPSELLELVDICKSRGVLEISVDNIDYLRDLGSGQYGLVFQGKLNEDIESEKSRIVAVKTLREGSSQAAIKEFCQEVNIMSTFSHPNIVKLIGVSLSGEPYCMIFEFVEFGDLASFLRNCNEMASDDDSAFPKLSVTDQLSMAVQIASGMKYISSIRCVHRDLAARNCLVGRGLVVKISDFGLSRDVYASEYYRMDKTRMLPVRWLPPEAFVDGRFTICSDIYSYGVVLWEIFSFAKLPYEEYDNKKTMELIVEGRLLKKPQHCPTAVYDIMMQCWQFNPEKRIHFPEIINKLCSLDDFGKQFEASCDEMKTESSVYFENETCHVNDEQLINVERLPREADMSKAKSNYAVPPSNKPVTIKSQYDGIVNLSVDERQELIETPQVAYPCTPEDNRYDDESIPIYGNVNVDDTYDIPPKQDDEDEMYSVPPISHDAPSVSIPSKQEETYNVPSSFDDDDQDEMYSVPPTPSRDCDDEEDETYLVPPISHDVPDGAEETYVAPSVLIPAEQEETYDVPPSFDDDQEEMYEVPTIPSHETYEVPSTSSNQPLIEENNTEMINEGYDDDIYVSPTIDDDDIYQNSGWQPKAGHYSVPQSPANKRRQWNSNNGESSPSSRNDSHSYENVDYDGKPLITS